VKSGTVHPWRRGAVSSPGRIAPGAGSGYDPKPKPEPPAPKRLGPPVPNLRWCMTCPNVFEYEGEPPRCCPECRISREFEAELHGIDPSDVADVELVDLLKSIASLEAKMVLHQAQADEARDRGALGVSERHRRRATLRSVERAVVIEEATAA
jgi:hypothetical protein